MDRLERENKNLHLTCSGFTSDEKANQNNAYEFMQLKNDHEICKKQKLQLEDLLDVKQDCEEFERKLKFTSDEKANQNKAYEFMQLKNDHEICKKQKLQLEEDLLDVKQDCEEFERKLNISKREGLRCKNCEAYKQKLASSSQEYEALHDRYNNTIATAHAAERNVQELREQVEEERKNIKEICEEMKSLENEKNKMEIELRLKKSSLETDSGDIINLRTENAELKHKIMNSKEEKNGILKENKKLKEVVQNLSIQVEKLESRLHISKDETSYVQQKNAELEKSLQEKVKQLKSSEARFRDLAGSIQNAEGLQNRIYTLELEVSELNKRLREYAVELEGIPSLKRRLENLQTDNAELEKRCRQKDGLLQNADSNAQKMKKDNQQLQTQMISQKQNYDTLNNKLESLKDKNIELEDRLRLSEAAGNKLGDNNPNIADLSDMNRPTSLAEKFSSLYTDEYTDAMKVVEDAMDEAASVKVMLDWLKRCYEWCQRLAKEQRDTLINRSIVFMENHGGQKVVLSDRCLIFVKEFQKKIAVESVAVVGEICHVKSVTQQTLSTANYIVKYIKKCSELCWMMQISDPPLYLNFDVNSGENLNKNDYNVFTKSGSKIDYLVWPVLYLHKTGPMLAKGVAQGK